MVEGVLYRAATVADMPFIFTAWLENYGNSSPLVVNVSKTIYFREHKKVVEGIVASRRAQAIIASLEEDPKVIVGFTVYEHTPDVIHYIYVKSNFRKMGIAREMFRLTELDPNKMQCSHWTYLVMQFKSRWPGLQFNPYYAKGLSDGIDDAS